jgi:hypothetical protein
LFFFICGSFHPALSTYSPRVQGGKGNSYKVLQDFASINALLILRHIIKTKLTGLKRFRTSVKSINSTSLKPLSHKTFVLIGYLLIYLYFFFIILPLPSGLRISQRGKGYYFLKFCATSIDVVKFYQYSRD